MNPRLLIVEDSEEIRTQLRWALAQDYEVLLAENRKQALDILTHERPSVVTLDLGLPPHPHDAEEGFHTLSDILQQDFAAKVIVITGQEEREHALKAIGQGAYDFFCKPIQIEELKIVLRRAFYVSRLEREHRELQQSLMGASFEGMLGTSAKMQEVITAIRKVATTDVPVLITGESGVGKELVARAIHHQGHRKERSFVVINCGAIPDTLLESELFGHEKGAFTGAHIQRKGRIESAQGGTLLLDEIGELPLSLQVKLLRFLQEHTIERIGARDQIAVDVRVVGATNRDLKEAISQSQFRDDLYYRLGVVSIQIPPLRERGNDLMLLATRFLKRFSEEHKKIVQGFTPKAIAAMQNHGWPGNVRELENRIRRAVIMAGGSMIAPQDLELSLQAEPSRSLSLKEGLDEFRREAISAAIIKHRGNIKRAALELGIARQTLHELVRKYEISL